VRKYLPSPRNHLLPRKSEKCNRKTETPNSKAGLAKTRGKNSQLPEKICTVTARKASARRATAWGKVCCRFAYMPEKNALKSHAETLYNPFFCEK
jgi:hypothetical protein